MWFIDNDFCTPEYEYPSGIKATKKFGIEQITEDELKEQAKHVTKKKDKENILQSVQYKIGNISNDENESKHNEKLLSDKIEHYEQLKWIQVFADNGKITHICNFQFKCIKCGDQSEKCWIENETAVDGIDVIQIFCQKCDQ